MAVQPKEDKSLEGSVAASGVPTVNPSKKAKDEEVTLSAHFSHDGKDYLPGDKIKVPADMAQSMRTAGYAKRED